MITTKELEQYCKLLRYDIVTSSTEAGSGHPTSSLSAVELMGTLMYGGYYRYDFDNPHNVFNDRILFSKGHASPLYYSLFQVAGAISYEELMTFRKFTSNLEGHPTPKFKYTEASTGSLGQGLSVGLGIALGIKLRFNSMSSRAMNAGVEGSTYSPTPVAKDSSTALRSGRNDNEKQIPKVFVLLGDSEFAEGQIYEALQLASHYKANNLVGILDVNRLGQRGETMLGWDLQAYENRVKAFGWNVVTLWDGHDIEKIRQAYANIYGAANDLGLDPTKPTMIIGKTMKGKGISFLENKDDWHGKPVGRDMLAQAVRELGEIDKNLKAVIEKPSVIATIKTSENAAPLEGIPYPIYDKPAATREAYGDALIMMGQKYPNLVVLDAETSNSTYADKFAKKFPERYFEMFIAEQNMVSVAAGLARMGFVPFVSSFAAFLTRAFDQIRMAQYSESNIKIVGSHAGVSIGYDGSSQMALEDLSMIRSILESVVLYPSDPISTLKLAEHAYNRKGIVYMRMTREKTKALYFTEDSFEIGGSHVLKESDQDVAVVFSAGITLHETLKAYETLGTHNIKIGVVDLYSVKPIDEKTIIAQAKKTGHVIIVEDHYPAGGIGEAVKNVLATHAKEFAKPVTVTHLCVQAIPRSGSPQELLEYEGIDAETIAHAVKSIM